VLAVVLPSRFKPLVAHCMLEGVRDLAVPRFDSSCLASQWLVLHSERSRDSALNERWRVSDVYGEANGLLTDVCS
jgi:hypothetical protein